MLEQQQQMQDKQRLQNQQHQQLMTQILARLGPPERIGEEQIRRMTPVNTNFGNH